MKTLTWKTLLLCILFLSSCAPKDTKSQLNDTWLLTKVQGSKVPSTGENTRRKDALVKINLNDNSISGTDGCNNFHGSISSVSDSELCFGPIVSTRMMCQDMSIADLFNTTISKVQSYKIENNQLFLFDEEGNELMVLRAID